MSNSYPNDLGSRPIFVRAWLVRILARSIFVCLLWLLFMTCHGRWWLWGGGVLGGRGRSIRIPLLINCLISYCLFTYAMFVQSKMTMLLYIGDDIRTFWRDQKRLLEGANRGRTDSGLWNTTHNMKEWSERTPNSKTGWIRICRKIVLKHNNQQIRCSRM